MRSNTKLVIAIVLAAAGVLLGALGAITAYNAKDAVQSDTEQTAMVQALVDQRFQEAQSRQDQIEAQQKSEAEKLVAQLTKGEKGLLQKINSNTHAIKKLKRSNHNLKQQVNTLSSRDREIENEIAQVENDLNADFKQLNGRINRTNQKVQQLQNQVNRLAGFIGQ